MPEPDVATGAAVDRALATARDRIAPRVAAAELDRELAAGALAVDIRPEALRNRDGALPGAVVIERNVLEWRLDPTSPHRHPEMTHASRRVIIVCDEGYASSLAAAALADLGLTAVTDLTGGFQALVREGGRVRQSGSGQGGRQGLQVGGPVPEIIEQVVGHVEGHPGPHHDA